MNNFQARQISLAISAFCLLFSSVSQAQTSSNVAPAAAPGVIFPKGTRVPAANFTGIAYLTPLVKNDPIFTCNAGSVRFEPRARTNWHRHPAGQILLVTDGTGYYQEEGQPARLLRKGEVVQCQPGVKHWHGASPTQSMTHIAIVTNTEKGIVTWLQPVTDQEYNRAQATLAPPTGQRRPSSGR